MDIRINLPKGAIWCTTSQISNKSSRWVLRLRAPLRRPSVQRRAAIAVGSFLLSFLRVTVVDSGPRWKPDLSVVCPPTAFHISRTERDPHPAELLSKRTPDGVQTLRFYRLCPTVYCCDVFKFVVFWLLFRTHKLK